MERSWWQAGCNENYTNDSEWSEILKARADKRNFAKDDPRLNPRFYSHPEWTSNTTEAHKRAERERHAKGLGNQGPAEEYITVYRPYDAVGGDFSPRFNETNNKKPRTKLSEYVPKKRKDNILTLGTLPKNSFEGIKVVPVSNYNPILQEYPRYGPEGDSDQIRRQKVVRTGPVRLMGCRKGKGIEGAAATQSTIAEYMRDDARPLEAAKLSDQRTGQLAGKLMSQLLKQEGPAMDEGDALDALTKAGRYEQKKRGEENRIFMYKYNAEDEARAKANLIKEQADFVEQAKQRQKLHEAGFNIITMSDEQGNPIMDTTSRGVRINLKKRAAADGGVASLIKRDDENHFVSRNRKQSETPRMDAEQAFVSVVRKIGPYFERMVAEMQGLDSTQSGMLPLREFRSVLGRYAQGVTETEVGLLVFAYDPAATGIVSYNSFLQQIHSFQERKVLDGKVGLSAQEQDAPQSVVDSDTTQLLKVLAEKVGAKSHRLTKYFRSMDLDNDGKISYDEFRRVLFNYNLPVSDKQFYQLVRLYDTDLSGNIDYSEFCLQVRKMLA